MQKFIKKIDKDIELYAYVYTNKISSVNYYQSKYRNRLLKKGVQIHIDLIIYSVREFLKQANEV